MSAMARLFRRWLKRDKPKIVYIVSVRDEDGYYIPVVAADREVVAWDKFEQWKLEHKDDPYWMPAFKSLDAMGLWIKGRE